MVAFVPSGAVRLAVTSGPNDSAHQGIYVGRAARRWRGIGVVLAVATIAAASAAGVLAFHRATPKTVDVRVVCTPASSIAGFVFGAGMDGRAASATVSTGTVYYIFGANLHHPGIIWVDPHFCVKTTASIPFSANGLGQPSVLTVTKQQPNEGEEIRCFAPHILIRLRETFDATGKSTAVALALRNERTSRPLAFITATTRRMTTYFAPSCQRVQ